MRFWNRAGELVSDDASRATSWSGGSRNADERSIDAARQRAADAAALAELLALCKRIDDKLTRLLRARSPTNRRGVTFIEV